MRRLLLILTAATLACGPGRIPAGTPASDAPVPATADPQEVAPQVVFTTDVQPILERCRPCHFQGGKMYDKLPFDSPDTIRTLGTALFSRIQDEREQAIISAFLAQAADRSTE